MPCRWFARVSSERVDAVSGCAVRSRRELRRRNRKCVRRKRPGRLRQSRRRHFQLSPRSSRYDECTTLAPYPNVSPRTPSWPRTSYSGRHLRHLLYGFLVFSQCCLCMFHCFYHVLYVLVFVSCFGVINNQLCLPTWLILSFSYLSLSRPPSRCSPSRLSVHSVDNFVDYCFF